MRQRTVPIRVAAPAGRGRHLVAEADRLRLSALLESMDVLDRMAADLRAKLQDSVALRPSAVPSDLVTMNSMVRGVLTGAAATDSSAVRIVTLAYPHAADRADAAISVLTPLGLELLGARVGDVVGWRAADGRRLSMRVDDVIFQPESSLDWHL
jgi:regulator of nucleoside diphosphate kinase